MTPKPLALLAPPPPYTHNRVYFHHVRRAAFWYGYWAGVSTIAILGITWFAILRRVL